MPNNHTTTNAASATQEAPTPHAFTEKMLREQVGECPGTNTGRHCLRRSYLAGCYRCGANYTPPSTPAPFDFEALCNNVAAAPHLNTEADAFRTLAAFAWEHLTPEGRAAMMKCPDVAALAARAAEWAAGQDDETPE